MGLRSDYKCNTTEESCKIIKQPMERGVTKKRVMTTKKYIQISTSTLKLS